MTGTPAPQTDPSDPNTLWPRFRQHYKSRLLHPVNLILCSAGAIITALIGPFDTYASDSFAFRLTFWSMIVFSATIISNFFGIWAELRFHTRPYWIRSAIGATLFTCGYFLFVWLTINTIYPTSVLPHPAVILVLILAITIVVYVTMWAFTVMVETRLEEQMVSPQPKTQKPEPDQPTATEKTRTQDPLDDRCPFLKRLGPDGGTLLIRLAMADHYIEAHTNTGMHLVYMRFADAIAELEPQNGTQIHRSHWVNFSQIEETLKNGQKITFRMSDGAIVPVSRSRKKALQDIGLI